jgi:hypothetical protein
MLGPVPKSERSQAGNVSRGSYSFCVVPGLYHFR